MIATSASTSVLVTSNLGGWCFAASVALGVAGRSLINDLHWWFGLLVRVFIVGIACFWSWVSRVSMTVSVDVLCPTEKLIVVLGNKMLALACR